MTPTEIDLPPELATAVRATAAGTPPLASDLGVVRNRVRAIRRRRAAVRATLAVVVVVALGAFVPLVRARLAPSLVEGGLAGSRPIALWQNRDAPPLTDGGPSGVQVPGSDGEIAAQLRTVAGRNVVVAVHPPAGVLVTHEGPAPLPGGGLATIGFTKDGPDHAIGQKTVVVQDADGRTVSSHPYPADNATESSPMPMTGNATTLFWWSFEGMGSGHARPVLLSYDIATGKLHEMSPTIGGNDYQLPFFGMQATDSRIINWPAAGGSTCSAEVTDTAGNHVTTLRPAIAHCTDVVFALSPDNERAAALVTYRTTGTWSQRVVVLDVRTGKIQKNVPTPPQAAGVDRSKLASGIDWSNDKTLRYARGMLTGGSDPILLTIKL
jgi:hypothetical protein